MHLPKQRNWCEIGFTLTAGSGRQKRLMSRSRSPRARASNNATPQSPFQLSRYLGSSSVSDQAMYVQDNSQQDQTCSSEVQTMASEHPHCPPSPTPSQLSRHYLMMTKSPSPIWSKWHAGPGKFWDSYQGWKDDSSDDCTSPREIPFLNIKRGNEKTAEMLGRHILSMLFTSDEIQAHITHAKSAKFRVLRYEDPVHSMMPVGFFNAICRRFNAPPSRAEQVTPIEVD